MLVVPAFIVRVVALVIWPYARAVAIWKAPVEEKYWPKITSDPVINALISILLLELSVGIEKVSSVPLVLAKRKLAVGSNGFVLEEKRAKIGKRGVLLVDTSTIGLPVSQPRKVEESSRSVWVNVPFTVGVLLRLKNCSWFWKTETKEAAEFAARRAVKRASWFVL